MLDENEERRPQPAYRLGEALENRSLAELDTLVRALEAEKARVEAERERKRRSSAQAEAVFRLK